MMNSNDQNNPTETPKDELPSWTKFHLKNFSRINVYANVIIDHHLIALVSDREDAYYSGGRRLMTLLAFDLLDHSLQETKIPIVEDKYDSFMEIYLAKYGENQIFMKNPRSDPARLTLITVESFQPFQAKCEEIETYKCDFKGSILQCYRDCLYTYEQNEVWSFDVKSHEWEIRNNSDNGPESSENLKSLVFQDSLIVYGRQKDLLTLSLNSMTWAKTEQQEDYLLDRDWKQSGVLYKDHLVTLENGVDAESKEELDEEEENKLCFLNLHTKNTWSTFQVKGTRLPSFSNSNMMVHNDLLWTFVFEKDEEGFALLAMNLEKFGICAPKSAEEEKTNSLFMKETDSNIAFKIGDQTIPAHKEILMKKSPYFEGLFGSGTIIEIEDCEYEIFQEFLRFIYQDTVDFKDIHQKMKLYKFAEKYSQDDLKQKCVNNLSHNINQESVCKILEFAHQEKILYMKTWCLKFFKDYQSISTVAGLIEYLDRQEDSQLEESDRALKSIALNFALEKFPKIYGIENEKEYREIYAKIYANFLLENLNLNTLPAFGPLRKYIRLMCEFTKESLLGEMKQRIEETLKFVIENMKTFLTNETQRDLMDFIFTSSFMNKTGSDIALKVADQLIPAHKEILINKSRYFEKVFNSSMAESKQDVIVIQEDCEYDIFKEYLQFIYQATVDLKNSDQAIKLYILADKYLQEDLCEKCACFLSGKIDENNVLQILDFAYEKNLPELKSCCIAFFKKKYYTKAAQVIEFCVRHQDDPEFYEELRSPAVECVLNSFFDEKDVQVFENFLLKNIEVSTISLFVGFLSDSYELERRDSFNNFSGKRWISNISKKFYDERTMKLKEAVFSFIHRNVNTVMTKETSGRFRSDFFIDFTRYQAEEFSKQIQDLKGEISLEQENNRGKKRMDPVQDGTEEENPTLKKTKASV